MGLIIFGLIAGVLPLALFYPFLKSKELPPGAQFESVSDLRRAMLERDSRDQKPEGSVSFRSIVIPHPSDLIMYELRPNLAVRFQGVEVRTNSCGMRGPERSIAKERNLFRIALLGDSFAFGWGVNEEQSFAHLMEKNLNLFTAGRPKVEVLNFGVPGYSTFQQVALLEEKGLDFKPDVVLVYFIENDFHPPFFIRDMQRPDKLLDSGTYAKRFGVRGALPINDGKDLLDNHLNPNKALLKLLDLGERHHFDTFLAINPNQDAKRAKDALWVLKKRDEIKVIRMRDLFVKIVDSRKIDRKLLVLPGDPHPSAITHGILADLLTEPFYSYLNNW